jgi:hypothetical protein
MEPITRTPIGTGEDIWPLFPPCPHLARSQKPEDIRARLFSIGQTLHQEGLELMFTPDPEMSRARIVHLVYELYWDTSYLMQLANAPGWPPPITMNRPPGPGAFGHEVYALNPVPTAPSSPDTPPQAG